MLSYPHIDPIALSIGPLDIRWYGIAYVLGILGAWGVCTQLANRGYSPIKATHLSDFFPFATLGILAGGRLGHVFLYEFEYYAQNPLEIIQIWKPGMAFHGGILGVILFSLWFCHHRNLSVLRLFDLISVGAPIGLFFGRLANFVNAELWGRVTESPFGMVFPYAGSLPRHPSQLYEAALEGVLLFLIQLTLILRSKRSPYGPGFLAGSFAVGYSLARGFVEFYREPEDGYIGALTAGQFWSLPLFIAGICLILYSYRHKPSKS